MRRVVGPLVVLAGLLLGWSHVVHADPPRVARQRVVLTTAYGDMVLALYPDVAPRHVAQILRLVELGAYDTTHFHRVDPRFVVQISNIAHRLTPLTSEQAAAEKPLPAEFSTTLKHRPGTLSMARWDDPHSATSSFSIVLAEAPHLDGQYTIFGHLESGGKTLLNIVRLPRDGTTPIQRITVQRARVVDNIEPYYAQHPRDPVDVATLTAVLPQDGVPQVATSTTAASDTFAWFRYVIMAMVLVSITGCLLSRYFTKSHLLSLCMLNVLIGGFGLLILLIPIGHRMPALTPMLFLGLFALFRLMSRFENT